MSLPPLLGDRIGLRRAAVIIFALVAVVPLLAILPLLYASGLLESTRTQVALVMASVLAVLGFVLLLRLTDEIAKLAAGVSPGPASGPPAAVPGLGRVTEIGQIGEGFTRLLDDLRASTERLEDLVFKLSTLNEVVELASRIPQLHDLLSLVLERTMRTVRASIGSVMLLDHDRGVLRVVAARGLPQGLADEAEVPVGEGVAGKVVQLGEAVLVEDISTDPRFARPNDAKYGSGAFMCLPVRVEDRVIGVVNLAKAASAPASPAFTPTDLQFLNTLMTHVAYAVDNARLLQEANLSANRLRRAMEDLHTTQSRVVAGETLRAVGQMASGMAHHVNNLLAVISGRTQLLLARVTQPEMRRPLEVIQRATFDAAEVVRRVLGFTAVQPVAEPGGPVELNELVREVVELTRPRWRDEAQMHALDLDVALELGAVPRVAGEAPALREVIMNLLFNAIDAMRASGRIRIATWAADDWAYCAVADTGVGMSEEVRRRAFEPFFTTKGPQGTGLGLSVAHAIVQRHGGDLSLRANEGGGTVVTVRLRQAGATAAVAPAETPAGPPLRILVIDDETSVREALADTLSDDGHRVIQASGGKDGLARLADGARVDVVITDLGMPDMTGWDVARAVRRERPSLAVGLVTGWAVALELSDEERRAVDFVIAKPYTVEALRAALARVRQSESP